MGEESPDPITPLLKSPTLQIIFAPNCAKAPKCQLPYRRWARTCYPLKVAFLAPVCSAICHSTTEHASPHCRASLCLDLTFH